MSLSIYRCPTCQSDLNLSSQEYADCVSCSKRYPRILGILDLRTAPAPDFYFEERILPKMIEAYHHTRLDGLLELWISSFDTPEELSVEYKQYHQILRERGTAMVRMFYERATESFGSPGGDVALDLGCGLGSSFLFLSDHFQRVVGIDISLVILILAKKYVEENSIERIELVCGQADALPFREQSFDFITATNVLEHVFRVDQIAREAYRVLNKGGMFTADSRNRFDLFFPEPHVNLRWVGLLPRSWAPRYVKWRKNREYHDTCLLSYLDLQKAFRQSFGRDYKITFPRVQAYGYSAKADPIIRNIEKNVLLQTPLLFFFPSHLVIARRRL